MCRYCCKSLFAPLIKNSPGYRRDVRVNMWGTSSPDDKLVSDLAKATEAIKIAARRSDRLMAGKLSPLNFGLLQQYLPIPEVMGTERRGYTSFTSKNSTSTPPVAKFCRSSPAALPSEDASPRSSAGRSSKWRMAMRCTPDGPAGVAMALRLISYLRSPGIFFAIGM